MKNITYLRHTSERNLVTWLVAGERLGQHSQVGTVDKDWRRPCITVGHSTANWDGITKVDPTADCASITEGYPAIHCGGSTIADIVTTRGSTEAAIITTSSMTEDDTTTDGRFAKVATVRTVLVLLKIWLTGLTKLHTRLTYQLIGLGVRLEG